MAGDRDPFIELCLELLAPLGPARARRMFGGHGLYVGDLFVAIVAGERLYLKADAASAPRFAAAGSEPFVYVARGREVRLGYWAAPAEAMDSPGLMEPWARLAMAAALRSRSETSRSPPPGAEHRRRAGPAVKPPRPAARRPR